MNYRNYSLAAALALLLTLSTTMAAWGHAAIVWAYVDQNLVQVEAFFPNNAKIQNATVLVVDEQGKTIMEGKTDSAGKFSYQPTSKKPQTIIIKAGESHVGDFELTAEDLAEIP